MSAGSGSHETEFDVFVSHANEDKEDFVRPLAQALEVRRLRVWYDEFTLRPGDSLRRSIDRGLLTSQAGIVVLSPAFFAKHWTAYELDGLIQLHAGSPEQIAGSDRHSRIIPVWHNIDALAVTKYSPSLANLVAIVSTVGVDAVADRVLNLLRPAGSTLLIARAELSRLGESHGWQPPIVTDDWWLDVVEASASARENRGRWDFPLPEAGATPRTRGHRLAWAAAQMLWQQAADVKPISQISQPDDVLEFIGNHPGLADICAQNPSCLLAYAPQLALPGAAGWLQGVVDDTWDRARDRIARDGVDPDSRQGRMRLVEQAGYLVLRDAETIKVNAKLAARKWTGRGTIFEPFAQVYEVVDYAGWLASDSSGWLGLSVREALLSGIAEEDTWQKWDEEPGLQETVSLAEWLEDPKKYHECIRELLSRRLAVTAGKLNLPNTGAELADRLFAAGFYDRHYFDRLYDQNAN
jgi:TIR domain